MVVICGKHDCFNILIKHLFETILPLQLRDEEKNWTLLQVLQVMCLSPSISSSVSTISIKCWLTARRLSYLQLNLVALTNFMLNLLGPDILWYNFIFSKIVCPFWWGLNKIVVYSMYWKCFVQTSQFLTC